MTSASAAGISSGVIAGGATTVAGDAGDEDDEDDDGDPFPGEL